MKLLFDQNLSHRLAVSLGAVYPACAHVRQVGLERADDEAVWNFARGQGFVIVSKDSDFHQRSFVLGFPPKVIWVRYGNCSTGQIERILSDHKDDVRRFCQDQEHAFLILG